MVKKHEVFPLLKSCLSSQHYKPTQHVISSVNDTLRPPLWFRINNNLHNHWQKLIQFLIVRQKISVRETAENFGLAWFSNLFHAVLIIFLIFLRYEKRSEMYTWARLFCVASASSLYHVDEDTFHHASPRYNICFERFSTFKTDSTEVSKTTFLASIAHSSYTLLTL